MSAKDRVYADLAATRGETSAYMINAALEPNTFSVEWCIGLAAMHAMEAWHFASRLTPEELQLARLGLIPRIEWTQDHSEEIPF